MSDAIKKAAHNIGFESVIFNTEFKHSTREPLRHYLWLKELELWINQKHNIYIKENSIDVTVIEQKLINLITKLLIK